MSKLFAVLLGGRAKNSNIELHDVVFVVGNSLEETYPQLVNKWFGITKRLHIDSSIELNCVDGYEISLSKNMAHNPEGKMLYFCNFGGYKPNYFGEVHEINFYVVASKNELVAKAKKELCIETLQQHCDDALLIDDLIPIHSVDHYYIHLKKTQSPAKLSINSEYLKLDVPEILTRANNLKEESFA